MNHGNKTDMPRKLRLSSDGLRCVYCTIAEGSA